jgi:hypothetical protein
METFVVRAWRSAGDDDPARQGDTLRGVVEHVGTGTTAPFQDEEQLIDFLRARPGDGG